MRVENLRLKLDQGVEVKTTTESVLIRHSQRPSEVQLPRWAEFLVQKLDGSVFLSDLLRLTKSQGERGVKLRDALELIYNVAKHDFLENSHQISKKLSALLYNKAQAGHEDDLALNSSPEESSPPEVVAYDPQRLLHYLRKTPLYNSSSDPYLKSILKNSEVLRFPKDQKVIEAGTKSKELYVLLEGRVGVFAPSESERSRGRFLALLQPVTVFGESAAVLEKVRTADVVTLDPSILLKVQLDQVLKTERDLEISDFSSLRTRIILHQLLFSTALFSGLPSEVFQLVLEKSSKVEVQPNQHVVEEGSNDKAFYLILRGSLGVYRDGARVATLGRGDHFGEIAALFNRPRSATLKAFTPSILLKIPQREMLELTCDHLSLGLHLEDVAMARLQAPRSSSPSNRGAFGNDLLNFDDLSNPFGSQADPDPPRDKATVSIVLNDERTLEINELELDFNFDFGKRD